MQRLESKLGVVIARCRRVSGGAANLGKGREAETRDTCLLAVPPPHFHAFYNCRSEPSDLKGRSFCQRQEIVVITYVDTIITICLPFVTG
jgi:hypothetical protein